MSASTSRPSLRLLMCSISGSLTAVSVMWRSSDDGAGSTQPSLFGSKRQNFGYSAPHGRAPATAIGSSGGGTFLLPQPRGRSRARAAGGDHHRQDPARHTAAAGGSRGALRGQPHTDPRGAAPAAGDRAGRAAGAPGRARALVLT